MSTVTLSAATALILRIRVFDGLTGRGLPDALPSLDLRQGRGDFAPLALPLAAKGAGWFVLAAPMDRVLAAIRPDVATRFRLALAPPGYARAEVEVRVNRREMRLTDSVVRAGGGETTVRRFRGAPFEAALNLMPDPIRLEGIVLIDGDPTRPEHDAQISVDGGRAVSTGVDGRFVLPALPQAATVEITARKGARTVTIPYLIDYAARPNRFTIALSSA